VSIGGMRKPMKSLRVLNRTCDFPSTQRECHSLSVSSLREGMVTQLVKKLTAFCGTQLFTSLFLRVHHWTLFRTT